MIRHYLPSIAAAIALVIAVFSVSVADHFPTRSNNPAGFRNAVVSAQGQKCSDDGAAGSVNIDLTSTTPQAETRSIFAKSTTFDPPIFITKGPTGGCCHLIWEYFFQGSTVLEAFGQAFHNNDYSSVPGGGYLVDQIDGNDPNLSYPFEIISYDNVQTQTIPQTFSISDNDQIVDLGTIASLVGVSSSSGTPGVLDERHEVTISISGGVKAGIGTSEGAVDGGKLTTSDFNERIYVCKNTIGASGNAGICDHQECDPTADPLCSDGVDNDADGLTDFPSDPGCTGPTDGDETNPACNDGSDNDGDGRIDFPQDPGCDNEQDSDETSPACSNLQDDDGDGLIDFPDDKGCDSELDNDEVNPPIDRNVSLQLGGRPQLVIQPRLELDEVLIIEPPCATCIVETTPDHTLLEGPMQEDVVIVAKFQDTADPSGELSYTIIAIGNYSEEQAIDLYTFDGRPYVDILN